MNRPRISVCLTHFNRPHLLGATLESLARQTRLADEVLLWDDASPNDPTEVARRFAGRFSNFIYHRNERNLGMPGNLNAVVARASGDYVANLHDADTFHPELLERWSDALDAHPSAGFVFCRVAGRNASQVRRLSGCDPITPGKEFNRRYFLNAWRGSSPVWGTVMARRSVYRQTLPFEQRYGCVADVDMWIRMSLMADVAFVDQPLINAHTESHFVKGVNWPLVHGLRRLHAENVRRCLKFGKASGARVWGGHLWTFSVLYLLCLGSLLRRGDWRGVRGILSFDAKAAT